MTNPDGPDTDALIAVKPDAAAFEAHRALLFSIAYRMLGSASEAEDVVQDTYLRYATSAPANVRSHRAWLGTVVTRLCLDRCKSCWRRMSSSRRTAVARPPPRRAHFMGAMW